MAADPKSAPGASSSGKLNLSSGVFKDRAKENKKKWMMIGLGALVVIVGASSFSQKKAPPQAQGPREAPSLELNPSDLSKQGWQAQSQADIKALTRRLTELERENRKLSGNRQPIAAPPPIMGDLVPPPTMMPTLDVKRGSVVPPPLPAPSLVPELSKPPVNHGSAVGPSAGAAIAPPASGYTAAVPVPSARSLPPLLAPPSAEVKAKRVFSAPEPEVAAADAKPSASVSYKINKYASYMTPGFAKAVLLHGIDASTSVTAQSNPQPVMLRIQDYAVLPGAARYDIKSCFVTAAASGNISSERVEMRLSSISCVDKTDGLVLEQEVNGYVVDADGSVGLRGKLVDRQGARLGKTMLAGFAEGLTGSAASASATTTTSAIGAVTTLSGSDAMRQAGYNGLSQTTGKLAEFYMKQAEAMSPILEVPANRVATVVFLKGVSLQWQDSESAFEKSYKIKAAK